MNSTQVAAMHALVSADTTRAERNLKNFKGELGNTAAAAKSTSTSMGLLQNAVGGFLGAFSVGAVASGALALGQLGEKSELTRKALEALAGSSANAQAMIAGVGTAAGGSLSELQAANIAMQLLATGVASNADEAERFTEIAATLGATMGQDVAQSVEGLRLAIDNVSYDRLGELGISAGEVRARMAELTEQGYALNEAFRLATLEIAQQRFEELKAAGYEVGTSTDRVQSSFANLAETVGTALVPALEAGSGALVVFLDALNMGINQQLTDFNDLSVIVSDSSLVLAQNTQSVAVQMGGLTDALIASNPAFASTVGWAEALIQAEEGVAAAAVNVPPNMAAIEGSSYGAAEGMSAAAFQARLLKDELDRLNNTRTDNFGSGGTRIDPRQFQEDRATEQIFGTDIERGFQPLSATEINLANRRIQLWENIYPAAVTTGTRRAASSIDKGAKEAQRALEKMYSNVRSAVTGAFDMSIDVTEEDLILSRAGKYKDKFNESGRRLQDVINQGTASPWVSFFPELLGLDGDALKASALQLQQDIEAFLRPDLLNPAAALETARRTLIGNANRENLAAQLTETLIGEGFGAAEVQKTVAEQMGIASMGAGEMAGPELIDSMAKSMKTAAEAKISEFEILGETFGTAIGTGTLRGFGADSIIAGMINKLTAAIQVA